MISEIPTPATSPAEPTDHQPMNKHFSCAIEWIEHGVTSAHNDPGNWTQYFMFELPVHWAIQLLDNYQPFIIYDILYCTGGTECNTWQPPKLYKPFFPDRISLLTPNRDLTVQTKWLPSVHHEAFSIKCAVSKKDSMCLDRCPIFASYHRTCIHSCLHAGWLLFMFLQTNVVYKDFINGASLQPVSVSSVLGI